MKASTSDKQESVGDEINGRRSTGARPDGNEPCRATSWSEGESNSRFLASLTAAARAQNCQGWDSCRPAGGCTMRMSGGRALQKVIHRAVGKTGERDSEALAKIPGTGQIEDQLFMLQR